MVSKPKLVYGVGVNDVGSVTAREDWSKECRKSTWRCPFYRAWSGMLMRCYSDRYQKSGSTYVGCKVSKDWLSFSVFRKWMERQDWEGNQLDKDIIEEGNKLYSPNTCAFVSRDLNYFLNGHGGSRGAYPIGVNQDKSTGRFRAQCRNPFTKRREVLGYFADPISAHQAWRSRKHELACQYADMQTDPRVAKALRLRFAPNDEGAE